MRTTVSNHAESIRVPATQIWPGIGHNFKPMLNVAILASLISDILGNAENADDTKPLDRKRKTEDISDIPRSNKRIRMGHDHVLHDGAYDDAGYPIVEGKRNHTAFQSELVPILRHVLDIKYVNTEAVDDLQDSDDATSRIWTKEAETLRALLLSLSESVTASKKIEIGEILLGEYQGRLVGLSAQDHTWLLLLPQLTIDTESNDLAASASDLLQACRALQNLGQIHLRAVLHLVVNPQEPNTASFPSFCLQIDLDVALALDSVLNNVMPSKIKSAVVAIEDARRRVFRAAFIPEAIASTEVNDAITVSSFYSILHPAPELPSAASELAIQPVGLLPTLLPFQRRSVAWLLEREGVSVTHEGTLSMSPPKEYTFWNEVKTGNRTLYLNRLSGEIDVDPLEALTICGGMLAEEPGLGKTVETIALILMNPAPPSWNPTLIRDDPQGHADLNAVKSTIIVTPPSLASQWKEELAIHAPSLKVLIYEGWSKVKVPLILGQRELDRVTGLFETEARAKKRRQRQLEKERRANRLDSDLEDDEITSTTIVEEEQEPDLTRDADGKFLKWCDYVHQYDVVITTYLVLRSEVHAARPGRDNGNKGHSLRSPLIAVEWKRVVMDEVQMVGGGSAAEMVSRIPRLSSLAVSGTPAKAQVADLLHVLKFLRVNQLIGDLRLCKRLLKPGFSEDFAQFLRHYGIRTTKSSVSSELTIPQQTRYLVGIELGRVERHVYDQALEKMLFDLGLDARGVAASSGWQADSHLLRAALRNLRGICTHPQVGQLQGKTDGSKPTALKTMDAVLQAMQDQNWKTLIDDWNSKIELFIRQAQLEQKNDTIPNNYQTALETLKIAGKESMKYIDDVKDALAKHDMKTKEMIEAAVLLRERVVDGKGKGRLSEDETDDESIHDDDDDEVIEEKGLPKTLAGKEQKQKGRNLRDLLRRGYILLHRVHFLQGDVYHVLGNSVEEDAAYQSAENVRHDLLKHAEARATTSIINSAKAAASHNITKAGLEVPVPLIELKAGISSTKLINELNRIVEKVLNEQADLIWEWRTHILGLLTRPLDPVAGGTEADGQEFQRTLDDQGEVEVYFQCYTALLADRREALINERTLLAAHTHREKSGRHTKAAMKAAAVVADLLLEAPEGLNIEPEHEVMYANLTKQRKKLVVRLNQRAVKSILVELNNIQMSIREYNHPEKILIKEALKEIRTFTTQQTSLHDRLEIDLNLLRRAFNQRIRYFWQLQEISDSVADVQFEEPTVAEAINVCVTGKAELDAKLNTTRARYRYLDNLLKNSDSSAVEEEKECVLCRCEFIRGYITDCGHVFCELCMKAWLHKKGGKTCPVCRIAIDTTSIQRFVISAQESEPPPRIQASGEMLPKSTRVITYNRFDPALFEEIQTVETYGDYGNKIQTLVRHLAHLKLADPGSKSIVFSAWQDSLNIVEHALRENNILSMRIGSGSRANSINKFRTDPNILVLLLHGENENAGLNVTCACRVFLLESVVHHSFEVQAIARIDRLGQTRPTEVFCYYAEDTVERNILDLAARKGLSLYTTENSKGSVSVSQFNEEKDATIDGSTKQTKLQKGDFIYRVDDMLAILFPHMFEDVKFLLPNESRDVEMENVSRPLTRSQPNARAGPSRVRLEDLT